MIYAKSSAVKGAWVKGSEVQNGTRCKIVSEASAIESQFKNKDGSVKVQDVAKVQFQGDDEPKNMNLNRPTIDGLIEAFGPDSKDWMNHPLIVQTEKVSIGGKRVIAVYLVADGFELKEDLAGYLHITKIGEEAELPTINMDEEPLQDDTNVGNW